MPHSHQEAFSYFQSRDYMKVVEVLEPLFKSEKLQATEYYILGLAYSQLKNFSMAQEALEWAVKLDEQQALYWLNLGVVKQQQQAYQSALSCYEEALKLDAQLPEAYKNTGQILQYYQQIPRAIQCFEQALKLRPNFVLARYHLANLYFEQNYFGKALQHYQQLLNEQFTSIEIFLNCGYIALDRGDVSEALVYFRRALGLAQDRKQQQIILSKLAFTQRACPELSYLHKWKCIQEYARVNQVKARYDINPSFYPERALKIGYIGSTFFNHSSVSILESLFPFNQDHQFELYCYSHTEIRDKHTERFESLSDHWFDIHQLSDDEAADLIYSHQIDILVDLVGHGANNRLAIFARKPAPIQITGLGYGESTGLDSMDYIISDIYLKPPIQSRFNTEKVLYIRGLMRWLKPLEHVNVERHIAGQKGIVFGCGNELFKINQQVIICWAGILKSVPDSILALKATSFDNTYYREFIIKQFHSQGIPENRLILKGKTNRLDHLRFYQSIDIALDPFPYNGGISTCDALWMGVPVLTLSTSTRTGLSLLAPLQRTEWITQTINAYIDKAIEMANRVDYYRDNRANLRQDLEQSQICQSESLTLDISRVYRTVWRKLCKQTRE